MIWKRLNTDEPEAALLRKVFSVEVKTPAVSENDNAVRKVSCTENTDGNPHIPVLRSSRKSSVRIGTRPAVIIYSSLGYLIAACARLSQMGYTSDSSAYIWTDDGCCLFLQVPDTSFFHLPKPFGFLTEYGEEGDAEAMKYYMSEYASELCPCDAVRTLGKLV